MFANVSEISSYVICPRLCYFRMMDRVRPTELHAVREIYLSKRKGFDENWAFERFSQIFGERDVFERALKSFRFDSSLDILNPIDWEIKLKSDKIRLKGVLDELVEFKGKNYPLILSLKSPEKGVWFRDRIRTAAFCMLLKSNGLECRRGFVYHCFDGELRTVEVNRKDRYHVMRLIEKVLRIKNGFVPDRTKNVRLCEKCYYKDACDSKPSTFASKFL